MDNDSQVISTQGENTQQSPPSDNQSFVGPDTAIQPSSTIKNSYETIMLVFGGLAIFSLLINNGFLLKLTGGIFLLVAIISIFRSILRPTYNYQEAPQQDQDTISVSSLEQPKKRSLAKYLGIIVLILVLLPLIAQVGFALFFIIILMLSGGGGRMGT